MSGRVFSWLLFASLVLGVALPVLAEPQPLPPIVLETGELPPGYLARVNLNQPADVLAILKRAEDYFENFGSNGDAPPVVMVLHGPEIKMFDRRNYSQYHAAADLAAKLTAFHVIDVRICETRMAAEGINKADLLPFVGTVPFGPDEESRLLKDKDFVYF